jgi:hypothetical protein
MSEQDDRVDKIYKRLLEDECVDTEENGLKSVLVDYWHESQWDGRYDDISEKEYNETLEIHKKQRRSLLDRMKISLD